MLFNIYRTIRFLYSRTHSIITNKLAKILISINKVKFSSNLKSNGIPRLFIHHKGKFIIGKNFRMNNTIRNNPIGRSEKCMFVVKENALLSIGNDVGISGVTIVCHKEIIINNNVKIGANVCIYDTDFHSLDYNDRKDTVLDKLNKINKKILIESNVFIGAHTTILKGVSIGENSIIGAGAVVTRDVPCNEIWAGNPAKFIKKIINK